MRRNSWSLLVAVVAGSLLLSPLSAQTLAPRPAAPNPAVPTGGEGSMVQLVAGTGLVSGRIEAGGLRRDYLLYVPEGLQAGAPAPLVLAFHGGQGSAEAFADRADLVGMAQRHGFILAVPEGIRGSWNNGSTTGYATRNDVDDLSFITALVDEIARAYPVDRSRVFATGVSAGGMMAYRLACDRPGLVAAIAVVAATLTGPQCPGAANTSLLHIHGTNDQSVPLGGGAGRTTSRNADYPSALAGIDLFRSSNACGAGTSERPASDTICEVSRCADGEVVELCQVEGGGHGWPGMELTRRQARQDVYVSQEFDATEFIGQFLASQ